MKGKIREWTAIAAVLAACAPEGLGAGLSDITSRLRAIDCYRATVDYSVSLPQADDDVRYTVGLESMKASPADTLSPVDYVIDWEYLSSAGPSSAGFSAYYDGHHYRYRGDRLQEYHTGWDSAPFATRSRQGGRSFPGVQRGAQFADLIPAFIAMSLDEMEADSLFTVSRTPAPEGQVKVRAVMTVDGVECLESVYTFALPDMRPLSIATESNIGTISEQSVRAIYSYPPSAGPCTPVNEQTLSDRWPDAFGKYRESNFRIENLPGTPLPAFSLPQPGGSRLTRSRGQSFAAPAMIVIIDPAKGFTAETVAAVRTGADTMPYEPQVIWAVASTNTDTAEALIGPLRPGEAMALNASRLARDCGAAALPVIVMCGSDGTVRDVVLGYNNDLSSVVMQKMSILK